MVRRLTAHYPDAKIAWILNWQGRKHAWHGREIPLEPARWPLIADGAPTRTSMPKHVTCSRRCGRTAGAD